MLRIVRSQPRTASLLSGNSVLHAVFIRQVGSATAGNILQQACDGLGRDAQPGEGEHLFAEVFQRGADVPDFRPVDNQEAVMAFLAGVHLYRRILAVVLLQVQLQLAADLLRVDVGLHADIALAEHQQHRLIYIVVNQDDGFFRRTYQVRGEFRRRRCPPQEAGRCARKSPPWMKVL